MHKPTQIMLYRYVLNITLHCYDNKFQSPFANWRQVTPLPKKVKII